MCKYLFVSFLFFFAQISICSASSILRIISNTRLTAFHFFDSSIHINVMFGCQKCCGGDDQPICPMCVAVTTDSVHSSSRESSSDENPDGDKLSGG